MHFVFLFNYAVDQLHFLSESIQVERGKDKSIEGKSLYYGCLCTWARTVCEQK